MTAAAIERTQEQRLASLKHANRIRTYRAQVKRQLRAGTVTAAGLLTEPPEELLSMRVSNLLLATPKVGRVKAARLLNQCRIAQSKTVGGLSDRQRTELLEALR